MIARNNPVVVGGILTRFVGGPFGGKLLKIPELADVLTIHPEDNQRSKLAGHLRQVHKYQLHQQVTVDGIPAYRYAGPVSCEPS
jgi:hypothetical protein